MQEIIAHPGAAIISLFTLTILEIVLGIDNVIFVSIIMGRLDEEKQKRARKLWMISGILVRIVLLLSLSWMVQHGNSVLFTLLDKGFTLRSLIMLAGGLFLLIKTVSELHEKLEGIERHESEKTKAVKSFANVMLQIMLVDLVFSFDSIITAVGIAKHVEIMILAVVIAMIIMFVFSRSIAMYIENHPTIKMLAMSFLIMVGVVLIVEGWLKPEEAHSLHLKNYVYFAMAFSFAVELLNMRFRKKAAKVVEFYEPRVDDLDESK